MVVIAGARRRGVHVPKLVLPCHESTLAARHDHDYVPVDSAAFKRQINVALGRSHSQRSPTRAVLFNVRQGRMFEKKWGEKSQSCLSSCSARGPEDVTWRHAATSKPFSTARLDWKTTSQTFAPAFTPSTVITPRGTWYEQGDKVFRFFGYIVDRVETTYRKAPTIVRLVILHFYAKDATLEMLESKETATPGRGRTFAVCRPSRVSLSDIRVGSEVLVNGTRVHVYDVDDFTRRSIPGLHPAERAPLPDKTFSITPRAPVPTEHPREKKLDTPHVYARTSGSTVEGSPTCRGGHSESLDDIEARVDLFRCKSPSPRDGEMHRSAHSFESSYVGFGDGSAMSQEPPGVLRMYIRWDDSDSLFGTVHLYILNYFLEDGTVEMRELADVKGGDYFQGRFPVMVRRQKVYKEGASPNLSVDRIGGDHAASRFSPRCSCSGTDGRGGATDGDMEQPVLTPHDMRVGQTVWLMKRPMTVCGWDETAHIWWENTTGMNMRGTQGDLKMFRDCMHPPQSQPRPPNTGKPSFFEGPPQRPGTVRGRFLKASENSGKTLRFLAKATPCTQTPSTRANIFIIRFYPEDDSLSVYASHNLGSNASGVFKGIYLARRGDMINAETGGPWKAGDFRLGFVAKLPSVSLEVLDVDDFSRHYLATEVSPPDTRWQTAPLWCKLLDMATNGARNCSARSPSSEDHFFHEDDSHDRRYSSNGRLATSSGKAVTFTGEDGHVGMGSPSSNDCAYAASMQTSCASHDGCHSGHTATARGHTKHAHKLFARLWAECVGDDTCDGFSGGGGFTCGGGGGRESNGDRWGYEDEHNDDGCEVQETEADNETDRNRNTRGLTDDNRNSQTQQLPLRQGHSRHRFLSSPSSAPGSSTASPWERLTTALSTRGVDILHSFSVHESTLLERELCDWRNGQGRGLGQGQSMAERLATAAAVAMAAEAGVEDKQSGNDRGTTNTAANVDKGSSRTALSDRTAVLNSCDHPGGFDGSRDINVSRQENTEKAVTLHHEGRDVGGADSGDGGDGWAAADSMHSAAAAAAAATTPTTRGRALSIGGFDFPAVVVDKASRGSSAVNSVHRATGSGDLGAREGTRHGAVSKRPAGGAGDGAEVAATRNSVGSGGITSTGQRRTKRQLDVRAVALDAHEVPQTGFNDQVVKRALAKVLVGVFGHGGNAEVLQTLKNEGLSLGDPADLWTMTRLLMVVAGLSRQDTEAVWLKFMPAAVGRAGEGGRVTFAGFLETMKAFEACLRRGELLGLSTIGGIPN